MLATLRFIQGRGRESVTTSTGDFALPYPIPYPRPTPLHPARPFNVPVHRFVDVFPPVTSFSKKPNVLPPSLKLHTRGPIGQGVDFQ